jgi:hypothetical protein
LQNLTSIVLARPGLGQQKSLGPAKKENRKPNRDNGLGTNIADTRAKGRQGCRREEYFLMDESC